MGLNRTFMELKFEIKPFGRETDMFKSHLYGIEIRADFNICK